MRTAYKVMFPGKGTELQSFNYDAPLALMYRPGEWTTAEVGGILVFETLDDVDRFLESPTLKTVVEIWQVECKRPIKLPEAAFFRTPGVPRDALQRLWRRKRPAKKDLRRFDVMRWPQGTLAFKAIRPVKEVDLWD